MTLYELSKGFPRVHELFVVSPSFTPPHSGDISGDLTHFLRAYGLNVLSTNTPPQPKRTGFPVIYGGMLQHRGIPVHLGGHEFATCADALGHALGRALEI
jgi:hypothetical protein